MNSRSCLLTVIVCCGCAMLAACGDAAPPSSASLSSNSGAGGAAAGDAGGNAAGGTAWGDASAGSPGTGGLPSSSGGSAGEPALEKFPNAPAGWLVWLDERWDQLPGTPGSRWEVNPTDKLQIVQHDDAPMSPANVIESKMREGACGTSSHNCWTPSLSDAERYATRLYVAFWRKWHPDWVNQKPNGVKDFWPNFERGANSPYTTHDREQMRIGVNFQGEAWGNRNLSANMGPDSHRNLEPHKGKWIGEEWYFQLNTTNSDAAGTLGKNGIPSRANGIIRAWVTLPWLPAEERTALVLEYTDVKFHSVDENGEPVRDRDSKTGEGYQPGRFRQLKWSPVYGGCGKNADGTPVNPDDAAPYDMFTYDDHVLVMVPPP
jgi:hypothetical protein